MGFARRESGEEVARLSKFDGAGAAIGVAGAPSGRFGAASVIPSHLTNQAIAFTDSSPRLGYEPEKAAGGLFPSRREYPRRSSRSVPLRPPPDCDVL